MRLDPQSMEAWRAFLEAHARVVKLLASELEDQTGLPLTWYDALVQLREAGGMLRMSDLADRLVLSRSATTRFVDRLEREGLIERRASTEDRRGMEVWLSEKGLDTLRMAAPIHLEGIARHFAAAFGESEREQIGELMRRLPSTDHSTGSAGA